TANTFAPYDPSKVEGSTSPNLPAPSSDDGGGCGVIGQVIMIVVAVVATIYTAGAAAGALGAAEAGAGAGVAGAGAGSTFGLGTSVLAGTATGLTGVQTVAVAAVAGAVGSAASQAVGNLIGAQHGFSWGQVAMGAVGAGVTAGVGAAAAGSGTWLGAQGTNATGIAAGVGRAAIGSVVTQGVSVAVGLQDHFSWQSVAASAVAGGVGAAVGGMAGSALGGSGLSAGVQRVVAGTAAGIAAGTTAAVMRGGRVEIAQIAADAFGNALGSSLAEANSAPPDVLGQNVGETNSQLDAERDTRIRQMQNMAGEELARDGAGAANPSAFAGPQPLPVGSIAPDQSMKSIVPDSQVVARGVTADGRAWEQWDSGATAYAVPRPVLDAQELPPLSKDQLAASAPASSITGSTFGDRLLGGLVGGAQASFDLVNGMVRVAGNSVLQIGDILTFGVNHGDPIVQQAWVEQGALAAGVAKLVTEPRAVASGAMESIASNYAQAQALEDKGDQYGASVIRAKQSGEIAGAVLGGAQAIGDAARLGGVALRGMGLSDWNVKFADYSPNTLYSNPIPLQLEPIATGSADAGWSVKPYSGDVYSPDFVGPVQWKSFYRGDATARTDFLSSMALERGAQASKLNYLEQANNGLLDELFNSHGNVGSQGLPTIGVSTDPVVAEFFARGPKETLINGVREWNREPSCSRFPHRGKE
ncbi:hypothetical protein ACQCS3_24965, partial [Ralstonia pseudosolanacearum]